ncbi:MAG TPA: hypothetical protein VN524_07920 [Hyphomicrobiaceae bacterium]|jgi:hypothetical protein|nr:hypothetical protein [Hyphomicrobiaceae bacterium]
MSLMSSLSRATLGGVGRALVPLALGVALVASTAWAQNATVRVRGTIERVEDGVYIVKSRDGAELKLKLAAGGGVVAVVPAKLADIKQGKYIGVTGMPMADGSQKAIGIHIFLDAQRGLAEGHQPWDREPNSTMTNANVEATVASAQGQVLTLKYKDGEKKIVVPDGTPIVAYAPGDASDMKPGAKIFVGGAKKLPDGTLETGRVAVSKGAAPPM